MSERQPTGDEEIVPAPENANPGTKDGVGEHALAGLGHEGVTRIEGEFGDLEEAATDTPPT
jgi:hypothetical protein